MGSSQSSQSDSSSNLKLEAQKIVSFSGSYDEWQVWKNRTECAFGASGFGAILSSSEYAKDNPTQNKVVYYQLSVATVDGTAYHIVYKYNDDKDGHMAWMELCKWYDGEDVRTEAAQTARSRIEGLLLYPGMSASEFVNKFLHQYRTLQKIPGEGYSKSHGIQEFLKSIKDKAYENTVSFCHKNNYDLDTCIFKIRMQERELIRERSERKNIRNIVRRFGNSNSNNKRYREESDEDEDDHSNRQVRRIEDHDNNSDGNFELTLTQRGTLFINSQKRRNLSETQQEFVKKYNAASKHGEDTSKLSQPSGVTIKKVRRQRSPVKSDSDANSESNNSESSNNKETKSKNNQPLIC